MSLTIEVPPEVQQALERQARVHAVSVPEYVIAVLRLAANGGGETDLGKRSDIAARLSAVERIGAYLLRSGQPPLPSTAVGESYREREDSQL